MADPRSRRTGEHNPQIIKLMADAAAMREQIDALEARILRLEAEVATARNAALKAAVESAARVPPRPASVAPAPVRPTKRPVGPPPLPKITGSMPSVAPRTGGRRSIVDISEIAELVESGPPPSLRPKK
jgi:hypothetical protein